MSETIQIPKGWKNITFADIVKNEKYAIKRGPWGSSIKKDFFVPDGYKVYQQHNVIYDDFEFGDYFLDEKKFDELKEFQIKSDDILISCSGTIGKVARVPPNVKKGVMNQALLKISPDDLKINSDFFLYLLKSPILQNKIMAKGTAMKNIVSVSNLKKISFNVPMDLKIQKQIVAKLDHILGELEVKKKQILSLIEQNKERIDFFEKNWINYKISNLIPKKEIPNGWSLLPLSEICSVERGKFGHRPRNDPAFYGGKYPFIQTGDVARSNGRVSKFSQTLNEKGLKVSRMFPKGTVVITISANIGDTAILEFDSCFPDSLIGLTPITGKTIAEYVEYALRLYQKDLTRDASQGTQKNINYDFLKPLLIPIPKTIIEQENIVRKIKHEEVKFEKQKISFENIKQNYESKINYINHIQSSVLDSAFLGKLLN